MLQQHRAPSSHRTAETTKTAVRAPCASSSSSYLVEEAHRIAEVAAAAVLALAQDASNAEPLQRLKLRQDKEHRTWAPQERVAHAQSRIRTAVQNRRQRPQQVNQGRRARGAVSSGRARTVTRARAQVRTT